MEDNELLDVSSPNESSDSVDLSSIINSLNDLVIKQGEIIENQNKLIEYFVPTDEEIKLQEEQMKKEEEEKLLQEEQIKKEEEEIKLHEEQMKRELDDYNNEVLTTLKHIKDNTYNSLDVGTVSSANSWILLFIIVTILIFGLLYKAVRAFI